ncbi:uncharacterized protein AAES06_000735 isoform 2-T2 [Glossophaga mutica]
MKKEGSDVPDVLLDHKITNSLRAGASLSGSPLYSQECLGWGRPTCTSPETPCDGTPRSQRNEMKLLYTLQYEEISQIPQVTEVGDKAALRIVGKSHDVDFWTTTGY